MVAVEYKLKESEQQIFHSLLAKAATSSKLPLLESTAALQTLLGFLRHRKAFTLPKGRVEPNALAFGRVTADIACTLKREGNDRPGWLPKINLDGGYRDNFITDYLRRLLNLPQAEILQLAESIWKFLTSLLLVDPSNKGRWKLDHERLLVMKPAARFVCNRCGIVTAYSAGQCCPRKGCVGELEESAFNPARENLIARWVAGTGEPKFTTLKSEEHTAQINKDLAKRIEDEFRAEGVNLLSSTTTFEMGINIGDLQKVLLRNAPPSSASYVQRVGRAGRGKDKNAVCVTLCRRTKYDGDAWRNPPMLMSGVVRTPAVFIENRIIAQRHFNAVAFARFLRIKVADEQLLGPELKQQIPLAAFLPSETVTNVPENWLPFGVFGAARLNFMEWLEQQTESDIFRTQSGRSLLKATSDFDNARSQTKTDYEKALKEIADELSELMTERRRLFGQGSSTEDLDRAVKNLLRSDVIAVLAKRGFLPRYAFPLDVVTLETGWSRWSRDTDVELSRDRAIAIAEFAPGAQVIARKKVFTSAGLYVMGRTDRPARKWYSRCPDCEQIRTSQTRDSLLGNCLVCQRTITTQYVKPFVEPVSFSVRIEKKNAGGERHRRTSLIRQRQSLTHFIDSVADSDFQDLDLFQLALKPSGKLFRYNLGPGNEGFILCPVCGHSEPKRGFKAGKKHKRLRASSGSFECANENPWTKPLAYGHEFESFCLIARPTFANSSVELIASIASVAFALRKGLCRVLEVESSDIGVSWRWLANRRQGDLKAEIILYDLTPGGAGFVQEGFDNWSQVVEQAREVCEKCKCVRACYDCLKDYSNQSHHDRLNRERTIEALQG